MVFDEPAPFRQPVIQTIRFPDLMNLKKYEIRIILDDFYLGRQQHKK